MRFLGFFNAELTERKVKAARKRFWHLARREAIRHGRHEVWYADVIGSCFLDEDVKALFAALKHDVEALSRRVVHAQSPDERSDVAARSGAFVLTQDQFSWPLDRAFDRAVQARRREGAGTIRPLDVLIGALASEEQDLANHIFENPYAYHLALSWEVAHPGVARDVRAPKGLASLKLYPDPFTPTDFVKRQLALIPEVDDAAIGKMLEAYGRKDPIVIVEDQASQLAPVCRRLTTERDLVGHPLRIELEAA